MLMKDSVQWGRTRIDFNYQFKDRKTLAIHVHPDLNVIVDAPKGTELERIREKVLKRADWIRKAKREFELYLPKQPPRQYINGESHRYLGRQYRIKARKARTECIRCYRGYFDIRCKSDPNPATIKRILDEWYWEKANIVFYKRYEELVKKASMIGVEEAPFQIRKLATRWGSCSKSGKITLNLELIKAPAECIDYVIVHELCHLKEHNHGPRFWNLVRKIIPDYQERKQMLNTKIG
ncbi:MAG: SprT family zinc-dependent metalloprotease [Porticoccaceae bacterium]